MLVFKNGEGKFWRKFWANQDEQWCWNFNSCEEKICIEIYGDKLVGKSIEMDEGSNADIWDVERRSGEEGTESGEVGRGRGEATET